MTATQTPPAGAGDGRVMTLAGRVVLVLIGMTAFAVSFDHVRVMFDVNGQSGWVAWALAVVVELLAVGFGLELVHRRRTGQSTVLPVAGLLLGVGVSLWGNLDSANPGPAGSIAAAFPAVSTLLIVATLETARRAGPQRPAAAPAQARTGTPPGGLTGSPIPTRTDTGTGTAAGSRTGTPGPGRTGGRSGTRTTRRGSVRPGRTDAELTAVLVGLPREPDGTVPIRRATAALGCGPDRARRLLTAAGLLRTAPPTTTPADDPVAAPVAA